MTVIATTIAKVIKQTIPAVFTYDRLRLVNPITKKNPADSSPTSDIIILIDSEIIYGVRKRDLKDNTFSLTLKPRQ